MADQDLEIAGEEIIDEDAPEIPEVLESLLLFALNECKDNILNGGEEVTATDGSGDTSEITLDGSVPFTVLAVKDTLFIETHPGPDSDAVMAEARRTVEGARGAAGYAFCYDGYVETDEGTQDAIIAEGGVPGADEAFAVGYIYKTVDDVVMFEKDPVFIGMAPNFMARLKEAEEYADEDIDERYNVPAAPAEAEEPLDEDMAAAQEGANEYLATHSVDGKSPLTFVPAE